MMNMRLADQRKLSIQVQGAIQALQTARGNIEQEIHDRNIESYDSLLKAWTDINFALQSLWGFRRDQRYHKFWTVPRCTCPQLDNEDSYPTGYYIFNSECPLHGRRGSEN